MPEQLTSFIQASAERQSQSRHADKLLRGEILVCAENLTRAVDKNAGVEVSALAEVRSRSLSGFWPFY